LEEWDSIEGVRRGAEDAIVDGHALVAMVDGALDLLVGKLAMRLLFECNGDRKAKPFVTFFPTPPGEVIRLGLANELAQVRRFHEVAKELSPSKEVMTILKSIAAIEAHSAPRPNIASIVAGTIPATTPRQPQWTTPTTAFLVSASTIGVQSAASATSAMSADLVTNPSHLPSG
jgi:hypothetical protein